MRVLVTSPAHFAITNDGTLWINTASLNYNFWCRYLDAYDEVYLLMRANRHSTPPEGWEKASGPGIKPIPLPDVLTPLQFLKKYGEIRGIIRATLAEIDAIQLRLPCFIASEVWRLSVGKRPYGVEVVGDPVDAFAPGAIKHFLRPFLRWWFTYNLQQQCTGACAVAYVTEMTLQRRYPPAPGAFSTHYSSIDVPDSYFISTPRSLQPETRTFTLINVASLTQAYKGHDLLIAAMAICVKQGLDLKLVLIGDGKYRTILEQQALSLGLQHRVHFCGNLSSRDAVFNQLDQADLFVMPSRTEGLPKAMIEAMARGVPCIGSDVGGIPELLPADDLVPPNNIPALAAKIGEVLRDPMRLVEMSVRNCETAKNYRGEVLRDRRISLYHYVRDRTEEWLESQGKLPLTECRLSSILPEASSTPFSKDLI